MKMGATTVHAVQQSIYLPSNRRKHRKNQWTRWNQSTRPRRAGCRPRPRRGPCDQDHCVSSRHSNALAFWNSFCTAKGKMALPYRIRVMQRIPLSVLLRQLGELLWLACCGWLLWGLALVLASIYLILLKQRSTFLCARRVLGRVSKLIEGPRHSFSSFFRVLLRQDFRVISICCLRSRLV
jgi:hypothetical protein